MRKGKLIRRAIPLIAVGAVGIIAARRRAVGPARQLTPPPAPGEGDVGVGRAQAEPPAPPASERPQAGAQQTLLDVDAPSTDPGPDEDPIADPQAAAAETASAAPDRPDRPGENDRSQSGRASVTDIVEDLFDPPNRGS